MITIFHLQAIGHWTSSISILSSMALHPYNFVVLLKTSSSLALRGLRWSLDLL